MAAPTISANSKSLVSAPDTNLGPHSPNRGSPQAKTPAAVPDAGNQPLGISSGSEQSDFDPVSHDTSSSIPPSVKVASTKRTFARPSTLARRRSAPRQGLLESSVKARLIVSCGSGQQVPPLECDMIWLDVSEWDNFWAKAEGQLEKSGEYDCKDESTRLCLQSGSAHIVCVEPACEKQSCFLENQKDWAVQLQRMIARLFIGNFESTKFFVEIRWTFTILSLPFDNEGSLRSSIRTAIAKHSEKNWEDKSFIPRKVLESIFTPDNVRNIIAHDRSLANLDFEDSELRWSSRETFAEHVYFNAVSLLAMCVFGKADLLCLYHLLKRCKKDEPIPVVHRSLKESDRPNNADIADFENLLTMQSRFRTHTFRVDPKNRESTHEKLDSTVTVPVLNVQREKKWLGGGAFGDVYEIRIHSDHHKLDSDRAEVYALKVFRNERLAGSDFDAEEAALRRLATKPHGNLVIHLAAWTQDNKFYMLFPCARENLRHYLSRPAPKSSGKFILNLLRQLRDLSSAVEHIHRLAPGGLGNPAGDKLEPKLGQHRATGLHYDLKPENILLFPGNGEEGDTWKISDFGTARIHDIVVSESRPTQQGYKSHKTKTPTKGDPLYGAPDYVIQGVTSRPYDVWSLGCILLEILLWAFHCEYWEKQTFADDRLESPRLTGSQSQAFWYEDGYKVGLKPVVIDLIETLRQRCSEWGVLPDLVNMAPDMLRLLPQERPRAAVVRSDMESLLFQADVDVDDDPKLYSERRGRSGKQLAAPPSNNGSRARGGSIDRRVIDIPSRRRDDGHIPWPQTPTHRYSPSGYRNDFADSNAALQGTGQHLTIDTNISPQPHRSRSPSVTVRSPDGKDTMEYQGTLAEEHLSRMVTEFSSEDLEYKGP